MGRWVGLFPKKHPLVLLNTGNGKGKSSSAFGMVARTLGYGRKAAVFQFIKGAENVGERAFFASQSNSTCVFSAR